MKRDFCIPYVVIRRAVDAEPEAIKEIIRHFHNYITSLATHSLQNEEGKVEVVVDAILRQRLEVTLILAVLKFRLPESI